MLRPISSSTCLHHSTWHSVAAMRVLFAVEEPSLFIILYTSFIFLLFISVLVLHHPESICRISFDTPIGDLIICLRALLLMVSAFLVRRAQDVFEVISIPYK